MSVFSGQTPLYPSTSTADNWEEAVACMGYLVDRHRASLGTGASLAATVANLLEALFPILDTLCRQTCPDCAAPCCAKASVVFDHRDLIFLHLTRQKTPPVQPRPAPGSPCAYLTPCGCRLPRLSRPWICTWYVCPAQKRLLSRQCHSDVEWKFSEIKLLRGKMEMAFIRAVTKS
jgi:hypothetical protein